MRGQACTAVAVEFAHRTSPDLVKERNAVLSSNFSFFVFVNDSSELNLDLHTALLHVYCHQDDST
jgi:hypothetical protein